MCEFAELADGQDFDLTCLWNLRVKLLLEDYQRRLDIDIKWQ